MMRKLLLLIAVAVLSGCATTSSKTTSLLTAPDAKAATASYKVMGYTLNEMSGSKSCPRSVAKSDSVLNDIQSAAACVRADKWHQVEELGNQMAIQFPNDAWGAYFLSLSAEHAKDWPRARWMAELAVKKAPNEGVTLYQLGRVQWAMDERVTATATLEKAVEKNPSLVEAHVLMGQLALMDNSRSSAEKSFLTAYQYDSKNYTALMGLAEVNRLNKHWVDAAKYLQQAISVRPKSTEAREELTQIKNVLEAEQMQQKVSERQPSGEGKKVSK